MNPDEAAQAWTRVHALIQTLLADVTSAVDSVNSSASQIVRRNFVRAMFAGIEGVTWALKQSALLQHRTSQVQFSAAEQSMLAELMPEPDDKGRVVERAARLTLKRNLQFSFHAFARSEGVKFSLATGEKGWEEFQRSLAIRDRLTHPKDVDELLVSDEELRTLDQASTWWTGQLGALLKAVMTSGLSKQRGAPFPPQAT